MKHKVELLLNMFHHSHGFDGRPHAPQNETGPRSGHVLFNQRLMEKGKFQIGKKKKLKQFTFTYQKKVINNCKGLSS